MSLYRASYLLLFVAAVVLLLGCLALWIYLPASGKSSKQIAIALLEYHNVTATNGLGALGTELPSSLMLYNDWNPSRQAGPDFADTCYKYYRLGIYFERTFKLGRNLPGGDTWTLTSTVQAFFPIVNHEHWWNQQFITISNSGFLAPRYGGQSNAIASDTVISRGLPGVWHMTSFAAYGNWMAKITIATNGDFSEICVAGVGVEGWKDYGKIEIRDGFLVTTVTNEEPRIMSKLPYTARERIIQADGNKIFISDGPLSYEFLLEKETK